MSAIENATVEVQESALELNTVLAALKQLGCADLFKVMRTATTEAEKRAKEESKGPKKAKGPTPPQLQKPKAWVQFVLKYSRENGWEEFIQTNKKSGEEIVMPASVETDGVHKFPNGKDLILTQAMSLSKQMWQAKAKTGTHEDVYREFETEFAARPVEESVEAAEPAAKPVMVRKTAEEKAAELEKKKAELAEKKEAAKAAKAAEKAAKTPAKAVKATATPAKAVKAEVKAVVPAAVAPSMTAVGIKPGKKVAKKVEEWSCPADGKVYPWAYKGKNYLRNADNQVWEADTDGGCGDWAGVYVSAEDRIDESVADPFA
jgi:hypothetical protein